MCICLVEFILLTHVLKKKYKRGGAGLYANIHAKRQRIASGSGETMRKPGEDGAPAKGIFKKIAEG